MSKVILYVYRLDNKVKYVTSNKIDLINYFNHRYDATIDVNDSIPMIENRLRELSTGYHELNETKVEL